MLGSGRDAAGDAPASMALIVAETGSMWPNSPAAMLDLAEAAAERLLDGSGAGRIGIGRRRQLGEPAIDAVNHGRLRGIGDVRARRYPGSDAGVAGRFGL